MKLFKKKVDTAVEEPAKMPHKRRGLKAAIVSTLMMIFSALPAFADSTEPAGDIGLEGGIETIGTFLTALFGWLADAAQVIITNWVLVIFVIAIPVAGWLFSLLFRLIGRGRGKK